MSEIKSETAAEETAVTNPTTSEVEPVEQPAGEAVVAKPTTTEVEPVEQPSGEAVVAKPTTVQVEPVEQPPQQEEEIDYSDLDDLDAPKHQSFQPTLDWLIDDFDGITENVYEAAMICAIRARQVGRDQKLDIDKWNSTHDIAEPGVLPDENAEQGVDHFHHPKPTVQALHELKTQVLDFGYADGGK